MAALTNQTIASTYKDLLWMNNSNAGMPATLSAVYTGDGVASPLSLSQTQVGFSNFVFSTSAITTTSGGLSIGSFNGTTTFTGTTFSVSNPSAFRTGLGLGTIATQAAASVSITGGSVTGITDLAIADGGTGASTASAALINLGVTAAAQTVLDDLTVSAMVDTLGGASSTGTGGLVRATGATFVTPVLGTPASGTLTNCTGLPISAGVSGLGTGVATFLATPSSANLASAITDETGSGALVFANSPTFVTPVLGVATATSINKLTITAPATSATLTIANSKTLTASNTLTFTGTDGSSVAFGTGGTAVYQTQTISASGLATGGGDLSANRTITVTAAVQADMEAATSNVVAVTPGVIQHYRGTNKSWAIVTFSAGTPSILDSWQVTSLTDSGTGITDINFTTAFSSANYSAVACLLASNGYVHTRATATASSCRVTTSNTAAALTDINFQVSFQGDQ